MSDRMDQLIALLELVRSRFEPGRDDAAALRRLRIDATMLVARQRNIHPRTVADKYIRQLRPEITSAESFDAAIWAYLVEGSEDPLRSALIAHADQHEHAMIQTFFRNQEQPTRLQARTESPQSSRDSGIYPVAGTEPIDKHKQLKELLVKIAELLQKHAKTEVTEGPFRYDVVWTDDPLAEIAPSHAFEVQVKGNLESALSKLQHARHVWRCGLSLIVSDERDGQRARQLVEERYTKGAFHPIRQYLLVLGAREVEDFCRSLKPFEHILKHWLRE